MAVVTISAAAQLALRFGIPAAAFATPSYATAQTAESEEAEDIKAVREQLAAQQRRIDAQDAIIAQQNAKLVELEAFVASQRLEAYRAAGAIQTAPMPGNPPQSADVQLPDAPVGEAPAEQRDIRAEVAAVPEGQGVLTPPGYMTFDPSLEYTQSATDRLVFRGFELVPGIQIGLIEASKARRETIAATAAYRFGLTSRLEVEVRMPVLHRYDRIEVAQQRDLGIVRAIRLEEDGIGDLEFAVRYQLNAPVGQKPIYVASLRVKSDTGKGPFDINYDQFGVATGLATGSGFWAVSPGVNILLPSDPVVLFGGASYLAHLPRNIDKNVGVAFIGRVDPGDAISANMGFGFALNPRFSFSLGYRHAYIFATKTEIGDTLQRSNPLQVGSLNFGMSYRITERITVNTAFEFGVTEDAPDLGFTLRVPLSAKLF